MAVWLFQANKEKYNLADEVSSLLDKGDWWKVSQYLDLLKPGDTALFWQSGENAGIYATGELISEPYSAMSEAEPGWRVDVAYNRLITPPILKSGLAADPRFQQLDVLMRGWSKNPFRVEDGQWSALQSLLPTELATSAGYRAETAQISEPMHGDRLYQERARAALPLLVRQAEAGAPIYYSDLATELKMPNPRNLNYVLGSIGQSLEKLSEERGEKIPPINCLVINKNTGLPGEGIGWFLLKKDEFSALPLRRKREIVQAELERIYSYPRWREVLKILSLEPWEKDYAAIVDAASQSFGGSGESPQHIALKTFVSSHPEIVGLSPGSQAGKTEHPLPSGDSLDVSFARKNIWVAAEVKSSISNEADIARGLFQCVKYLAVMEAALIAERRPPNARAVLVLEGCLPLPLVPLKNLLQAEVIEGVHPTA
jgi:hypothetical protein